MSHKRTPKRKAVVAAGSIVALGAAALILPNAMAGQSGDDNTAAAPRTFKATDVKDVAAQLSAQIGDAYAAADQDHLDGLTVDLGDWWFNVRPSNTEPLLRLNLEAATREACDARVDELRALITKET